MSAIDGRRLIVKVNNQLVMPCNPHEMFVEQATLSTHKCYRVLSETFL